MNVKKTKIVATLGPACNSRTVIHNLIKSGVNVFRINFSHAKKNEVLNYIEIIRSLNKEHEYNTAILADLQGPKIRIGELEQDITLKKGDKISIKSGNLLLVTKMKFLLIIIILQGM